MPGRRAGRRVGYVVLAYGPNGLYESVVESLLKDGAPPRSIIVVHNPSDVHETRIIPPHPDVGVFTMNGNLGYAGGMNFGISRHVAAGMESVLLLTHDVSFHPGALRKLLEVADSSPRYGILGPALWWAGRPFSYGGLRDARGAVSLRQSPPNCADEPVLDADWVEGSAILISAAVFAQVGLLDERFFMYFEETEFCLRAARAGWAIGIVPDAVFEQEPGFEKRPAQYGYLVARNGLEYARLAAGGRGVALAFGRFLKESWNLLKIWQGRRSRAEQRRFARARLIGVWTGVAAYLVRRWGPPPSRIRRLDAPRSR